MPPIFIIRICRIISKLMVAQISCCYLVSSTIRPCIIFTERIVYIILCIFYISSKQRISFTFYNPWFKVHSVHRNKFGQTKLLFIISIICKVECRPRYFSFAYSMNSWGLSILYIVYSKYLNRIQSTTCRYIYRYVYCFIGRFCL